MLTIALLHLRLIGWGGQKSGEVDNALVVTLADLCHNLPRFLLGSDRAALRQIAEFAPAEIVAGIWRIGDHTEQRRQV